MTNNNQQQENPSSHWEDDVLGRKSTADFIYKILINRHKASHSNNKNGSLCVALDADWGAGKTFFVQRWAKDIKEKNHPVIQFDAWINDLTDDPLLGFMSELQKGIEPWIEKMPTRGRIKKQAQEKMKSFMKEASKAVMPVTTIVLKGVAKKLTTIDFDDIKDAIENEENFSEAIPFNEDDVKALSKEALEKFLEIAMKSHRDKQAAIYGLKRSLQELLNFLKEKSEVSLPMFILVDELDRCRPDYAIRLLEGTKHLFDSSGLCFVFSTNLVQLSESAKAVYGSGFDGYRYLKRFFSTEYRLPDPYYQSYATKLALNSTFISRSSDIKPGLPRAHNSPALDMLTNDFSHISKAFNLDLRSQQQVFEIAETASLGIELGAPIHTFHLFTMAAAYTKGQKIFELFSPYRVTNISEISKEINSIEIAYSRQDHSGRREKATLMTPALIKTYLEIQGKSISDLEDIRIREPMTNYPNSLISIALQETNGLPHTPSGYLSLRNYYDLVKNSGEIRNSR